jgi:hypothetical protein
MKGAGTHHRVENIVLVRDVFGVAGDKLNVRDIGSVRECAIDHRRRQIHSAGATIPNSLADFPDSPARAATYIQDVSARLR